VERLVVAQGSRLRIAVAVETDFLAATAFFMRRLGLLTIKLFNG